MTDRHVLILGAERRFLCVDHAKSGCPALHFLASLASFDEILTGSAPDPAHRAALDDAGARPRILDREEETA